MVIAVIFAGGASTRLKDWVTDKYGEDKSKLLIPVGKDEKPFLQYNIERASDVFDANNVYVLSRDPDIVKLACELGVNPIVFSEEEYEFKSGQLNNRSGQLRYTVENGCIPEEDIVTVNGSDLVSRRDLTKMKDHEGNAMLIAKEYYGPYPENSKPNVVHYENGEITGMRREIYDQKEGTGLHTGTSRLAVGHERLGLLEPYTNIEETLFTELIDEGNMEIVPAEEKWYPLKTKEHAKLYQGIEFED